MKIFFTTALFAFSACAAEAQIFITRGLDNAVGTYDAATGATIHANLITGLANPTVLTIANGAIYVANTSPASTNKYSLAGAPLAVPFIASYGAHLEITGDDVFTPTYFKTIGKFTASGAVVNDSFITTLDHPGAILRVGNILYVTIEGNNTVATYNATTGAAINPSFISGLTGPSDLAILNDTLYVANFASDSVGIYNVSGAAINASFLTGLNDPVNIAVFGGFLYVANRNSGTIGKYNAFTGATVNATLITASYPVGIAVAFDKSSAIDLGTISDTSAAYAAPDRTTLVNIPAASAVAWYKFTIPASAAAGRFLDIATMPTAPSTLPEDDTEIGLYNSDGILVASDDDSSVSSYSQLSFSATPGARGPLTATGFFNASPANGQGGPLAAGTYYLAVAPYNAFFKSSEFDAASASTNLGTFHLEFRTDIPAPTALNLAPTVAVKAKSIKPTKKSKIKIAGTSADANGEAPRVFVKVGRGKFRPAKVTGFTWSIIAKLKIGKNPVQVYSRDAGGLRSPIRKTKVVRRP